MIANDEIVTMYDELGFSVEEIVAETGYEPGAVKVILADRSTKYNLVARGSATDDHRKGARPGETTDADLAEMTDVIRSIARNGENDGIRLKAATYLRDDRLGRLDVRKEQDKGSLNINVLMLNQGLKKLRAMKSAMTQQLIEA